MKTYSEEQVYKLFEKLVVRGVFKSDRDYKIAKQTLLEQTEINYDDFEFSEYEDKGNSITALEILEQQGIDPNDFQSDTY